LVDTRLHAEELARFESQIVRGPQADDCAMWVGAIGGDGTAGFWVRRDGGTRIMVRANRYALAAAQDGEPLAGSVRALRGCDNPFLGGFQRVAAASRGSPRPGDRNKQSGTMLSPNSGEITPTGN
jgi:hypothetical protein